MLTGGGSKCCFKSITHSWASHFDSEGAYPRQISSPIPSELHLFRDLRCDVPEGEGGPPQACVAYSISLCGTHTQLAHLSLEGDHRPCRPMTAAQQKRTSVPDLAATPPCCLTQGQYHFCRGPGGMGEMTPYIPPPSPAPGLGRFLIPR